MLWIIDNHNSLSGVCRARVREDGEACQGTVVESIVPPIVWPKICRTLRNGKLIQVSRILR